MLLVLEKKTQRTDPQTVQTVNDPGSSYQPANDINNNPAHGEFGPDAHPENTQNEDDLPF